jgi:hypothetical protein
MRIYEYLRFPPMRVALAALVLALGVAVWNLVGALRAPVVRPGTTRPSAALSLRPVAAPQPVDIDAAVASDLFDIDRAPADQRFRMPGEAPPTQVVQQNLERPTVLGTTVSGNGFSFATAQLGSNGPRIIREGDRLGDYMVRTIERGHVVFTTSSGTRLDIAASAAQTQEPFNAPITRIPPAGDSAYARAFYSRGAARGRGRAARDTIPRG